MRLFEPADAFTLVKLGPDFAYKFSKGNPIGGRTLQDELWMVGLQRSGLLVCVENTNPVNAEETPEVKVEIPAKQGLDLADILPHTKPDVVREKGYQTHEEFAAKIEVAKAEEQMKAMGDAQERIEYEDQDTQDFYDFLVICKGESEEEMIQSVNQEYLEAPLVVLCEKLELDSTGEKSELIGRIIDWFSLTKYREELLEEVPESIKILVDENVEKLCGFIGNADPEENLIELMKLDYNKKSLVNLCEILELDSEGNKGILAERLIDWFSLKGE